MNSNSLARSRSRRAHEFKVRALKAEGKDYKEERLKIKVAKLVAKGRVNPKRSAKKVKTTKPAAAGAKAAAKSKPKKA